MIRVVRAMACGLSLGALAGCDWFGGEDQAMEAGTERPAERSFDVATAGELEARARWMSYDLDGDGQIDADEASSWFARRFARLDQDNDGRLSRDELASAPMTGLDPERLLEELDRDGDRQVSEDEFSTVGASRFKARAEGSQGSLSPEEFDRLVRYEEQA